MSSDLDQELRTMRDVVSTVPGGGEIFARAVHRVMRLLVDKHEALGAIVERQDHRLLTLETWSSAQTVEEPLAPRWHPGSGPVALEPGDLQKLEDDVTACLRAAQSDAPDSALRADALRIRLQFAKSFKAVGWAPPEEVQKLRQAIDDAPGAVRAEFERARSVWERQRQEGQAHNEKLLRELHAAQAEARRDQQAMKERIDRETLARVAAEKERDELLQRVEGAVEERDSACAAATTAERTLERIREALA